MIKRPLSSQFAPLVLSGVKTTTIRDTPWPVGVPIMLYRWEGKPYRSKQIDVAAVVVESVRPIRITHRADGGMILAYGYTAPEDQRLHETEGFASRAKLDDWFRPLVKRGTTAEKYLMAFNLKEAGQ